MRRLLIWACACAAPGWLAPARADHIAFSGAFGTPSGATTALTAALAGGSYSGWVDLAAGAVPLPPGGRADAADFSLTLSDASGAAVFSKAGTSYNAIGQDSAGVIFFAAPGQARVIEIYVDLAGALGGVQGSGLGLNLTFDPAAIGYLGTSAFAGSPEFDQSTGLAAYSLPVATASTNLYVSMVAAPEPASLALLGLGAPGLAWAFRRRG